MHVTFDGGLLHLFFEEIHQFYYVKPECLSNDIMVIFRFLKRINFTLFISCHVGLQVNVMKRSGQP